MKKILLAMALVGSTFAAADDLTVVHQGHWTSLPNCGGETAIFCSDSLRLSNEKNPVCKIRFRNVVNCPYAKLYMSRATRPNFDMFPTTSTYPAALNNSPFYVDFAKVMNGHVEGPYPHNIYLVNAFAHSNPSGVNNAKFDKIQYQWDYAD